MNTLLRDLKFAARSLASAKGLTFTVIVTLALGIGANAAIFTLVRGVLLRPLVNRGEERLVYIHQSAPGIGIDDTYFSVPEILDLKAGIKTVSEFGDFSTIPFSMVGLGEPREVRAGVVGGSYFEVMGLHPVLGRLLDARDDGPKADGAAVLTHRFWVTTLKSDPHVIGKMIRLDTRTAKIVGVLEPCIPYPAETEIIANIVTSPHHLSATMVQGRVHRMTELFGRLAPGATLESANAELKAVYGSMVKQHPEAYSARSQSRIDAVMLRDQITSRARTVLLVLLAASLLVFIIACSNVANLILARGVRREGELAIRAALGASPAALRRTLLAESLLLCGTGAILGVAIAGPMVSILARYAARFSVRALDLTVDAGMLWVGAGLAVASAVFLAFVPRLPSATSSHGYGLANASTRTTGNTSRRQRIFAVVQIAASFMLLAGASMLLKTLLSLQSVQTGLDVRHVLAINVPVVSYGRTPDQIVNFYKDAIRRIHELPGVDAVSVGMFVPWRDAGFGRIDLAFSAEGWTRGPKDEDPRARLRVISPGFFSSLGVPIIEGRDFNDSDTRDRDHVVIVSLSLAKRVFPNQDALDRHLQWTDPLIKFIELGGEPRRIVGVVPDIDDENVVPGPMATVYHPFSQQQLFGGRVFVHERGNPYALVTPITRIIRSMSVEQPVEHAATLEDVRAEVLTPDRLNAVVFGGFAIVALAIAIVGVAGVLAFSVSGRMREFGIRLAIGSQPGRIVTGVVREGVVIAFVGLAAGVVLGWGLTILAAGYFPDLKTPSAMPVIASSLILLLAAIVASMLPALRAARVDIVQALRAD